VFFVSFVANPMLPPLQSLWAFPTTAVGLAIGTLALPFGARWQRHSGVIEIHGGPVTWLLQHATLLEGGALAMTLGEVVLGVSPAALDLTRTHERVHVRQCRRWGPFFLPAYAAASLLALAKGRHFYRQNAFEVEAYTLADRRPR
jgi:hypothetical protein